MNTLTDDEEEAVYGYVYQADTNGIKAAWQASDHHSGIVSFKIAVGSTSGNLTILYFVFQWLVFLGFFSDDVCMEKVFY